ncbi:hypothetical protein T484DRAFT_1788600 [Baffinella frigidus]|nr:hypothetical protein T484DRAFT_1788600 [Cryptophyta sp. CCMP2293]
MANTAGWSYEKHALMQPVCCTPEQLSRRLQAGLQGGIPIGAALRWSVSVSNMAILSITLQRQFQLKMAPTLAYAFGLIISASGPTP